MEQENLEQTTVFVNQPHEVNELENRELHSIAAIDLASYVGSPLAATLLMRQNYKIMGQPEEGKKVLITGIISTILLFTFILMLPEEVIDVIPNPLIPLVYTIIIHFWAKKVQGDVLDSHTLFYSRWRAVGIGLLVCLFIVIAIVIVMLGLDGFGIIDLDAM